MTPAGRRASLLVRMTNAARKAGFVPRRIHLVLAIDRLLARLLRAAPGQWVVKGGYANQLRRPDEARFTEDLDLKIDASIETAPELLDLVWLIRHFTFGSEPLAIASIATFERRTTHPWPPVIDVPPDSWTRPYGVWRAELDLAEPTPAAAASALRSFLEPVYFSVAGRSWDPSAQEWRQVADEGFRT